MRYTEINLFEDRTQGLANRYAKALRTLIGDDLHDEGILHYVTELMKYDPTPQKQYSDWIISRVSTGKILVEDLYKVEQYLKIFYRVKAKLPQNQRDINYFTDEKALFDVVEPFQEEETQLSSRAEQAALDAKMHGEDQIRMIYNDPEWKIISPRTREASCYFGKNTQWCTASEIGHNFFDSYNRKAPLIILLKKKENKRYQFQFPSFDIAIFMDERDRRIDIYEFIKENPKIAEILGEQLFYPDCFGLFLKGFTEAQILNHLKYEPSWIKSLTDSQQTPARKLAAGKDASLEVIELIKKPWPEEVETNYWSKKVKSYGGLSYKDLPEKQRTKENLITIFAKNPEDMVKAKQYVDKEIAIAVVNKLPRALRYVPKELRTFQMLMSAGAHNWFNHYYGGYVFRLKDYVKKTEWPSTWVIDSIEHGEITSLAEIPLRWKKMENGRLILYGSQNIVETLFDYQGPSAVPKKYYTKHMLDMLSHPNPAMRARFSERKEIKARKDPSDLAHYPEKDRYSNHGLHSFEKKAQESNRFNPMHNEDTKRENEESMAKRIQKMTTESVQLSERVEKVDGHLFHINPTMQQIKTFFKQYQDKWGYESPPEVRGVSDGEVVYIFLGDMHHNYARRLLGIEQADLCFYVTTTNNEYFTGNSPINAFVSFGNNIILGAAFKSNITAIKNIPWVKRLIV